MELRGATTIAESGRRDRRPGAVSARPGRVGKPPLLTAGVATARGGGASVFDVPSSRGRWQVPPTEWKEEGCDERSSP